MTEGDPIPDPPLDPALIRKIFLLTFVFAGILISLMLIPYDFDAVILFMQIAQDSPFFHSFAAFMDQTIFDGNPFGGQDPSFLLFLGALIGYFLTYIPAMPEKFRKLRLYFGFVIAVSLSLTIISRGFKALFARVRPSGVLEYPLLYSPMWWFGHYSFDDALSKGSFISGHTTMAVVMMSLGFISLRSKKRWVTICSFVATGSWALLMAAGRVFEGKHFPSDTIWAIWIGVLVIIWIYYAVLKIPDQEEGEFSLHGTMAELRWTVLFLVFSVFVFGTIISLRYIFIGFIWYLPIMAIGFPIAAIFIWKRMQYILYGSKKIEKNAK